MFSQTDMRGRWTLSPVLGLVNRLFNEEVMGGHMVLLSNIIWFLFFFGVSKQNMKLTKPPYNVSVYVCEKTAVLSG